MHIELEYFDGCPNWRVADVRLSQIAAARGLTVHHRLITSAEDAEAVGFRGSPTIRIEGRDPFARGDEPVGFSCRLFQTSDGPSGSPTVAQLEAALDG